MEEVKQNKVNEYEIEINSERDRIKLKSTDKRWLNEKLKDYNAKELVGNIIKKRFTK